MSKKSKKLGKKQLKNKKGGLKGSGGTKDNSTGPKDTTMTQSLQEAPPPSEGFRNPFANR